MVDEIWSPSKIDVVEDFKEVSNDFFIQTPMTAAICVGNKRIVWLSLYNEDGMTKCRLKLIRSCENEVLGFHKEENDDGLKKKRRRKF